MAYVCVHQSDECCSQPSGIINHLKQTLSLWHSSSATRAVTIIIIKKLEFRMFFFYVCRSGCLTYFFLKTTFNLLLLLWDILKKSRTIYEKLFKFIRTSYRNPSQPSNLHLSLSLQYLTEFLKKTLIGAAGVV